MNNKEKNKPIAKVVIPIAVIAVIILAVAAFVFFVPVAYNDCDSPCSDPMATCPSSVCVKTQQTIWDILTNQKHVLGY